MTDMDIVTIITSIGSLLAGGGIAALINLRSSKRKATAEANIAEDDVQAHHWDNLDKRIDDLHDALNTANETTKYLQGRVNDLNHALDDKTDRIRELTNSLLEAHTTIVTLTEQRDAERMNKEHYRQWLCENSSCTKRIPPNPIISGLKYEPPKETYNNYKKTEK